MPWRLLAQGYTTVASSRAQAEAFYASAKALVNGLDPKAHSG